MSDSAHVLLFLHHVYIGQYYCSCNYCGNSFLYKSRYEQHLKSVKHRQIVAVIDNEPFDNISNSDSDVSSSSSTQDILSAIALEENKDDLEINALLMELNADMCTENTTLEVSTLSVKYTLYVHVQYM